MLRKIITSLVGIIVLVGVFTAGIFILGFLIVAALIAVAYFKLVAKKVVNPPQGWAPPEDPMADTSSNNTTPAIEGEFEVLAEEESFARDESKEKQGY